MYFVASCKLQFFLILLSAYFDIKKCLWFYFLFSSFSFFIFFYIRGIIFYLFYLRVGEYVCSCIYTNIYHFYI